MSLKVFIYSGTHWDREWYESFQGFRFRLVNMTDGMLDGLDSVKDYGVFHFDGQTVVLHDYLEINPERREQIKRLIQAGKLVVGPWYDMPDEFLISGESIIRNLRMGHKIAREEFGGEPAHNAYICDIFGHSSQTPQIFAGMNLHHTVLGRGTNQHTTPMHFRWQALDGTEVTVCRLDDMRGYGDFTTYVAWGDTSDDVLRERLKGYIDERLEYYNIPVIVLFDAQDHCGFRADTSRYARIIKELYPDAEVYHTNIDEMGKAQDAYHDQLPVKRGELNETTKQPGGYCHLITNTLSSRYPLKKRNDMAQTKLEKWISPMYGLRKTPYSIGFFNTAYRFLIQNHPHDSICGCSIDQVHRDMMYRFDQIQGICTKLEEPFYASLAGDIRAEAKPNSGNGKGGKMLRIYNPLPYEIEKTVTADIRFEDNFPRYMEPFGYEDICNFKLYDCAGNEIPYGIVDRRAGGQYTVAFTTKLNPLGITEFSVIPQGMPTRYPNRLPQTTKGAESKNFIVKFHTDGSFDLTDKRTGETYRRLLSLIDDGEIGDGWYHCNPATDKIVTNQTATVEMIENNCKRITWRVNQLMMLPAEIDRSNGIHRSNTEIPFHVVHDITLADEDGSISVVTRIDNNVKDHRLKLRLPTGIESKKYFASQAFGFVERRTGDDKTTADWKEYGCIEKQTAAIVGQTAGKRGLAFISAYGLHECAVDDNGNMDITLFRAFCKTVGTAGEPDGELIGNLEFRYNIRPITETEENLYANLQREQDYLAAGTVSVTASGDAAYAYTSALAFSNPAFAFSTLGRLDDGATELRLYNVSEETQTGKIRLPAFAKKAVRTEIDGRVLNELPIENGEVELTLTPWKIATVRIEG